MITKIVFLFSESFRTILRTKLPAAISSITIAIALIIFSLSYTIYINIIGYSFQFKSKYNIEVFFENNLEIIEARDLFNTILILDGIEQGEFIDKNKASKLFTSYFKESIENIIGENPLPMGGKFDIAFSHRNAVDMKGIVKEIRLQEGVESASYQHGIIAKIDSIIDNILGISIVFGITIFVIAMILVSNTMRLIIDAKKATMETLHLLGATNAFIRFPLILEGIMQGALGAGISILFLFFLISFQEYLIDPLIRIPVIHPKNIVLYNIFFGLVLALIGSLRGISKYLSR